MGRAPRFLPRMLFAAGLLSLPAAGFAAAATPLLQIRFDGRRFTPQTLTVPAHRPLVIEVINASRETIEFESFKLNREVTLTPGQTVDVHLPALSRGRYDFHDDFHGSVPKGYLVAQ